jgi:hypothetical protein
MTATDMNESGEQTLAEETSQNAGVARVDRAEGIVAAARMYVEDLSKSDAPQALSARTGFALDGFIDALSLLCPERETGPDRARWSTAARESMRRVFDALRDADRANPDQVPMTVLVRAAAEAVRWDLVDRRAPDPELWAWLDETFAAAYGEEVLHVTGERDSVAREYLRAVAYHAAALDQQTLKTGFVIARLIEMALPQLLLTREVPDAALYGVDLAQHGVPLRLTRQVDFSGWRFVTLPASDMLSDIDGELAHGQYRAGLEKMDLDELRAAVAHLRRQWSGSPPMRRFQRYPLDTRLTMVRGYDQTVTLLGYDEMEGVATGTGSWHITDLSRGGVGVTASTNNLSVDATPTAGDLVAFCLEEGTRWHVGVVRRVRTSGAFVEIGIATLSDRPGLSVVDDGRAARELCLCDPVRRGEVVRLVGPVGALGEDDPLFVTLKNAVVHKLRPLASALRGKSFDLRVYQVV